MRKLKLELAELEVTSFETPTSSGLRGTVAGHKTAPPTEFGATCDGTCEGGGYTCDYQSCGGICPATCWGDVCSYGLPSGCGACTY
jgi:hypothetical protein